MILQTKDYSNFQILPEMSDMPPIEFVGSKDANHCLPGDLVNWDGNKCQLVRRAKHRFIPGVLELNSKYLYGHTSRGAKMYLFHPHDRKYPPFRVGCSSKDTSTNLLALIEFMDWEDYETIPRGNILRILGPCGDVNAEKEALIYQFSSPSLARETFDIGDNDESKRTPLEGFTFNIDPDGCMDIDDVFTLKQRSDTLWDFVITISDVAGYILEGSPGDRHAFQLGQTLYQNGEAVVPMLPPPLSELAFSLRPRESHLGISLFCQWNTQSKTLEVDTFRETIFKNNFSFTYDTIYKADEFPLEILKDIASYLKGEETKDSHEWVAEAMIFYNKQVAQKLLHNGVGLLRTHQAADIKRLDHLTSIHPDLKALAYEAAQYEVTGVGKVHAGLGSVPYCHASSPIRRYADLYNQRCLKALLKNNPAELSPCNPQVPELLNLHQKHMRRYERSLFFLEQIASLHSGDVEGIVVDVTPEKTKVYIPAWKHTIRADPGAYEVAQKVSIAYYADLQKPYWDQRMVFRILI